jgi:3-hydroxyisobutyrate dehydrogenase
MREETRPAIGFVGTGHMGSGMAANLLKAGYAVTVYDRRKEATDGLVEQGATYADSPKAAAAASTVTISVLPGPPEIEAAVLGEDGILAGLHEGDYYIDMSTSTPSLIRRIAALAKERGAEVLDAPVSGGVRGARTGTLAIMAGGSEAAYAACEPIFQVMGNHLFHVGDVGAGCAAKLVNNIMGMSNTVAAMEAMVIGTKAGVDPRKLMQAAEAGTGQSFMLSNTFNYIVLPGKFEPTRFAMALAAKDFHLARDYAEEIGVPVRIVQCMADALDNALKEGFGDRDFTSYIRMLEEAAGVEVRG